MIDMLKIRKKTNPADLTGRNNQARKKEINALKKRVKKLEDNWEGLIEAAERSATRHAGELIHYVTIKKPTKRKSK